MVYSSLFHHYIIMCCDNFSGLVHCSNSWLFTILDSCATMNYITSVLLQHV